MAAMASPATSRHTDKVMRLHAQTTLIENGFVRIPEDAPWLAEYLHELTVFPNGKHDDQVELDRAVSRLVQEAFSGSGTLRVERMQYERFKTRRTTANAIGFS